MPSLAVKRPRSFAELTRAYFGEVLSVDEVLAVLQEMELVEATEAEPLETMWVGSVGYENHRDHRAFARHLSAVGVERLIDVRQLPISRRRGYAKQALAIAMSEVGIEYVHMKELGNPKPFRDLYKSGQVAEGRRAYEQYLLGEQGDALRALEPLLSEKRSALMCMEHDAAVCHRTAILDALHDELGLELDVREIT